jgi:hypothetical protein
MIKKLVFFISISLISNLVSGPHGGLHIEENLDGSVKVYWPELGVDKNLNFYEQDVNRRNAEYFRSIESAVSEIEPAQSSDIDINTRYFDITPKRRDYWRVDERDSFLLPYLRKFIDSRKWNPAVLRDFLEKINIGEYDAKYLDELQVTYDQSLYRNLSGSLEDLEALLTSSLDCDEQLSNISITLRLSIIGALSIAKAKKLTPLMKKRTLRSTHPDIMRSGNPQDMLLSLRMAQIFNEDVIDVRSVRDLIQEYRKMGRGICSVASSSSSAEKVRPPLNIESEELDSD